MSFRTAYGNEWSENGWRMCDRNECDVITVPGANQQFLSAMIVRKGPAFVVMQALARAYHQRVEPLDLYQQGVGDDWGWSKNNDVGDSNHLSGTGLDFNAVQYPWGKRTMPTDRVNRCLDLERDFQGFVFWGRHWSRVDEMHWQIGVPEFDPDGQPNRKLAAFAKKLEDGYLNIYGPPDADAFPLPAGYAWGPLSGPDWSISNIWQPRPEWVAGLKRWQTTVGIPASGIFDADTERMGRALQVANGWPVTGMIFEGEWNVVIRHGQKPDLSDEPRGMEYADTSQWQTPIREGYPHPFFMFRANNGNDVDRNASDNLGATVAMVNDHTKPLRGFGVYTFWRPGEDNFGALKRAIGDKPHPRMVVMIDVESAEGSTKGTVRGDQSAGVNAYLDQVRAWIGDPKRVHLGYINQNINAGLWKSQPQNIWYVIPDYSAPKGKPRVTAGPRTLVHQYTQTGRCAPWGDAPIDLNYYPGTATEFLVALGLDSEPIREPAEAEPIGDHSTDVPFPLGPGQAYGPLDGPGHAISGQWKDDPESVREGLRQYQRKLGLDPTGLWITGSPVDLATRKIQEARGWKPEGPGWIYQGEWDVVMNGAHPLPLPVPTTPPADGEPHYCSTCPCAPREGETGGV